MADSLVINFPVPEEFRKENKNVSYPANVKTKKDRASGNMVSYSEPVFARSPLTEAGFVIKPIFDDGDCNLLSSYTVELNPPACLVGPNHLLVNGVLKAAEGAHLLLKHWLVSEGASPLLVECFNLEHAELLSVTPTVLFECDSPEEALDFLREVRDHSEGVLNNLNKVDPLSPDSVPARPRAFSVGPSDCFTIYAKDRLFTLSSYIKNQITSSAASSLKDAQVMNQIREIAERTLRLEVQVNHAWLRKHELNKVSAWRNNPEAYHAVFEPAREILRLDDGLRVNMPSAEQLKQLPQKYQEILRNHFAGENIRNHPAVTDIGQAKDFGDERKKRSKRFSAIRLDLLKMVGVDIEIPWERQTTCLSARLKKFLVFPGEYVPDADLAEYIFSRTSVPKKLKILQQEIDNFFE